MFKALAQLFATFQALFKGTEHLANAFSHAAEWAEDESAGFRDKAAKQRAQNMILMDEAFASRNKELNITPEMIDSKLSSRKPRALPKAE